MFWQGCAGAKCFLPSRRRPNSTSATRPCCCFLEAMPSRHLLKRSSCRVWSLKIPRHSRVTARDVFRIKDTMRVSVLPIASVVLQCRQDETMGGSFQYILVLSRQFSSFIFRSWWFFQIHLTAPPQCLKKGTFSSNFK